MKRTFLFIAAFLLQATPAFAQQSTACGTEHKANARYGQQAWLVGANCVPSDAINELEMLRDPTFNPALINAAPYRECAVNLMHELAERGTPSTTKTEGP